jgi:hypothetical protein
MLINPLNTDPNPTQSPDDETGLITIGFRYSKDKQAQNEAYPMY